MSTGQKRGARLARVRPYVFSLLLCAALALLLKQLNAHYKVADWLVVRYGMYWLIALSFFACVTPLGFAAATKIGGPALPLRERIVLSVPLGLLGFVLLWASLGAFGLFHAVTFFVAPLLCLAVGMVLSFRSARRVSAHRGSLHALRRPPTALAYLVIAGGVIGTLFVYAPIVLPENAAFDARWYHLAIAEHFAAAHRYTGFPDGWALGGMPFLATLIYTWAFVMPGSILFDRIEVCAHLEFFVVVATMFSLPVLVERLLPGTKGRFGTTWATIFLFPGIFLYDSSLVLGADHFAALWAIPIFLMFLRAWKELALRPSILLGLMVGAAISTKYTAFGLGLVPGIGVVVRSVGLGVRTLRRKGSFAWVKTLPVILGAVLLASSHFWLKNIISFGNPVFPFAPNWFPTHPWVAQAADRMAAASPPEWRAIHDLNGVRATLRAAFTFAFLPNDWAAFHKDWPVFGPLFTLTTPMVAFVRRPGRLVTIYAASYLFVIIWYWTLHQDRYLQTCMPWMAAGTAAVLASVWQGRDLLPKIPCALLVAVQVASSMDIPFFPTHAMISDTPLRKVVDMAGSGFRTRPSTYFRAYEEWASIGEQLPKAARVLIHENQTHVGIGVQTVNDQFQTGISYLDDWSPGKIYDRYRRLAVTHVLTNGPTSKALDAFGGDVAFFNFVTQYGLDPKQLNGHVVYRMPEQRPNGNFGGRVLWASCKGWYKNGVYEFRGLSVTPRYGHTLVPQDFPPPLYEVPDAIAAARALPDVDAVVNNPGCVPLDPPLDTAGFVNVASREGATIWVRRAESHGR